jgi:rod shape-determining protein MreD
MIRVAWILLMALLASWTQIYFLATWRPAGIVPNLLAVVVILAGLAWRVSETLILALAGGLLLDLASGSDFGLRMAFFSLLALLVAVLARLGMDFENVGILLLLLLGATVIYNLAVIANLVLTGEVIAWGAAAGRAALEFGFDAGLLILLRLLRWGRATNIPQVSLRSQPHG